MENVTPATEAEDLKVKMSIEDLEKKIKTLLDVDKISELVANNEIVFTHKGQEYKVRKLNFTEKQELNEHRLSRFTKMMRNESYMSEKQLIASYKTKGIDIDAMDNQYDVLENKKKDLLFKLGKAIQDQSPDQELMTYRDEIKLIEVDQRDITMRKTVLLEASLESQIAVFLYSYMAYQVCMTKEGDNWVKTFKTYDDFMSFSDDSLINMCVFYVSFLTRVEV